MNPWVMSGIAFSIFVVTYLLSFTSMIQKEVIYDSIAENIILDEVITPDRLEKKVTELKEDVLKQLAHCETNGVEEPDGFVKMDSNDFLSWGRYQYQRPTVQLYVKKFYNKEINNQRAGLIAWDLDEEIKLDELTLKIIFEDEGKGWKNWLNCGKKIGIEQQIAIIKKLEN